MHVTSYAEHDQLHALVRDARATQSPRTRDELECEIIRRCRPVAWGLAHRYADRGAELDDLRAVADAGVLGAIRRFDPDRGQFISFAAVTVSGEIKKYFRDSCWAIRPSRSVQELQSRVAEAAFELQSRGESAVPSAIADRLGVPVEDVKEAQVARGCFTPTSLDAPAPGRPGSDGVTVGVEEIGFDVAENRLVAERALAVLDRRERELLRLRFFEDLTQQQIAAALGSSQKQVSRDLQRVLRRLRSSLEAPTSTLARTA